MIEPPAGLPAALPLRELPGQGLQGNGGRRLTGNPPSLARARGVLRSRLEARRTELEQAALARAYAISDPTDSDPLYREGLRASVSTAFDYAFEAIERGEKATPLPPPALLAQARLAARSGISLDTVLRRYYSGCSLLSYFLTEEATRGNLVSIAELQCLLGSQAKLVDRVLAAVGEEYEREVEVRRTSSQRREVERIERLLAGELVDTSEIPYDFSGWHVGVVATGTLAIAALRDLAERLDRSILLVSPDEGTVWAWLGGRQKVEADQVLWNARSQRYCSLVAVFGEPCRGIAGWCRTHHQARIALQTAERGPEPLVRYADVGVLATVAQDDLLASLLESLYITPLEVGRGASAWETLRAYFMANRNISSAAATIGITRQAVSRRLRTIEERLGRPLEECALEVELALRLRELKSVSDRKDPS